ncbi:hypothetical protein HanRHA438_Chr14g0663591 [Helianthus annuus]|nr:hypothetical protein HanRHA438_Chr14g0663591 [Helianthus annuus]
MFNRFKFSSSILEQSDLPFRQYDESQCLLCKIKTVLGSSRFCCVYFNGRGTLKLTTCKSHGNGAVRGEKDLGGG